MPYPGGKSGCGVYHRLCAEVPPHDERISPFLGHCAVMRHLRPAALNVGVDRDERALELWKGFTWPGRPERLQLVHGDGVAWLRHRFGLDAWPRPQLPLLHPENVFRQVYLAGRRSSAEAALSGGARATTSAAALPGTVSAVHRPAVPFLFVDPPYPRHTRAEQRAMYAHELTDEQHADLLGVLRSVPALVMVVSYPNALYGEQLADWRSYRYRSFTRGGPKWEQCWCNYPPPVVLHDWRYLGRDRRQRETIARRVRSWRKMFRGLAPTLRAALLEGLSEEQASLARGESHYSGVCHRCGTLRPPDVRTCCVCTREPRPGDPAAVGGGERSPAAAGCDAAEKPRPMARRRARGK